MAVGLSRDSMGVGCCLRAPYPCVHLVLAPGIDFLGRWARRRSGRCHAGGRNTGRQVSNSQRITVRYSVGKFALALTGLAAHFPAGPVNARPAGMDAAQSRQVRSHNRARHTVHTRMQRFIGAGMGFARRGPPNIASTRPRVIFRPIIAHVFSPNMTRCFSPKVAQRLSPKLPHFLSPKMAHHFSPKMAQQVAVVKFLPLRHTSPQKGEGNARQKEINHGHS